MGKNVIQINGRIAINIDVSVKKVINVKKIMSEFENIISGIQLYNKKYHQKVNHFQETEKDDQ